MTKTYGYVVTFDGEVVGFFNDMDLLCEYVNNILVDSEKFLDMETIREHITNRQKRGCDYLFFPYEVDNKHFTEEWDLVQIVTTPINSTKW